MKASTIVTLALVGTGASYVGYRALRPADPNPYNSSTRPYGAGGTGYGYRSHAPWVGGGGGTRTTGYRSGYQSGYGGGRPSPADGGRASTSSGTSRGGFGSVGHSSSSGS